MLEGKNGIENFMGGNYRVYSLIKPAYDLGQLVSGIIGQKQIIRANISLISIMVSVLLFTRS